MTVHIGEPEQVMYDVSAPTLGEVAALISAYPEAATAEWWPDLAYDTAEGVVSSAVISVPLRVTMPRWPEYTHADQRDKDEFDRFWVALRHHEQGHFDLVHHHLGALDVQLVGELEETAQGIWQQALQQLADASAAYDDATAHGLTQGATLTAATGAQVTEAAWSSSTELDPAMVAAGPIDAFADSVVSADSSHTPMITITPEEAKRRGAKIDPNQVNVPKVDPHLRQLRDEDAGGATTTMAPIDPWGADMPANYCDSIARVRIGVQNWVTLGLRGQPLTLILHDGHEWTTTFGAVDMEARQPEHAYVKRGGVIYPTDASGNVVSNGYTMPNLVRAHEFLDDVRTEAIKQRIKITEVVIAFEDILRMNVAALGVVKQHTGNAKFGPVPKDDPHAPQKPGEEMARSISGIVQGAAKLGKAIKNAVD